MELARESGNRAVELAAMLTEARAMRESGEPADAEVALSRRLPPWRATQAPSSRLKDVLREWAALRADAGDHRGAYELTREALAVN